LKRRDRGRERKRRKRRGGEETFPKSDPSLYLWIGSERTWVTGLEGERKVGGRTFGSSSFELVWAQQSCVVVLSEDIILGS